ncbi:MAG: M23 family metallopeptidase [Patescibacteria group bacterium]|nr:M23 family metallopeptidase [Patescibacteria group bacterium]MBU1876923.1 M23 family metallopeptidase [Patescibacteria group bacterium]
MGRKKKIDLSSKEINIKFAGFLKENLFWFLSAMTVVLFVSALIISAQNPITTEVSDFQSQNTNDLFLGPINKFSVESPDLVLIQKNTLKASLPPTTLSPQVLGALVGIDFLPSTRRGIIEYVVESGDTLSNISQQFNVSIESLLWANDLNKNTIITIGKTLVIPPVSGVIYHVQNGDTISNIAQIHKAKTSDIIAFNELSSEGDIFLGDILMIPDGTMPAPVSNYQPQSVPLASGYFVYPIDVPYITQGLHWYNAIDFSNNGGCGESIYAAAAGTVIKAQTTTSTSIWAFGGGGNHITILHPNGVITYYGHLSKIFVVPGQEVSRYQIIGLMGGQPGTAGAGLSTGCHLHFGVTGATNPFAH